MGLSPGKLLSTLVPVLTVLPQSLYPNATVPVNLPMELHCHKTQLGHNASNPHPSQSCDLQQLQLHRGLARGNLLGHHSAVCTCVYTDTSHRATATSLAAQYGEKSSTPTPASISPLDTDERPLDTDERYFPSHSSTSTLTVLLSQGRILFRTQLQPVGSHFVTCTLKNSTRLPVQRGQLPFHPAAPSAWCLFVSACLGTGACCLWWNRWRRGSHSGCGTASGRPPASLVTRLLSPARGTTVRI